MSGNSVYHSTCCIQEIADEIYEEYKRAVIPRPPLVEDHYWYIKEEFETDSEIRLTNINFKSYEEAVKHLQSCYGIKDKKKKLTSYHGHQTGFYTKNYYGTNKLFFIIEATDTHYADGNHYPDYTPEALELLKESYKAIAKAYVYAHRVDYLLAGDDGDESFIKRTKEDLAELEEQFKRLDQHIFDNENED